MASLIRKCDYLRIGANGEIPPVLCSATGHSLELDKAKRPIRLAICPLQEQTTEGCEQKPFDLNNIQTVIKL